MFKEVMMSKVDRIVDRQKLEFFSVAELCFHYGVTTQTIYNWCKNGWLPSGRDSFNNYIIRRVDVADIDRVGARWFPHLPKWRRPEAVFKRKQLLKEIEDAGGFE
jgi:hypothetical protein